MSNSPKIKVSSSSICIFENLQLYIINLKTPRRSLCWCFEPKDPAEASPPSSSLPPRPSSLPLPPPRVLYSCLIGPWSAPAVGRKSSVFALYKFTPTRFSVNEVSVCRRYFTKRENLREGGWFFLDNHTSISSQNHCKKLEGACQKVCKAFN